MAHRACQLLPSRRHGNISHGRKGEVGRNDTGYARHAIFRAISCQRRIVGVNRYIPPPRSALPYPIPNHQAAIRQHPVVSRGTRSCVCNHLHALTSLCYGQSATKKNTNRIRGKKQRGRKSIDPILMAHFSRLVISSLLADLKTHDSSSACLFRLFSTIRTPLPPSASLHSLPDGNSPRTRNDEHKRHFRRAKTHDNTAATQKKQKAEGQTSRRPCPPARRGGGAPPPPPPPAQKSRQNQQKRERSTTDNSRKQSIDRSNPRRRARQPLPFLPACLPEYFPQTHSKTAAGNTPSNSDGRVKS